MYVCEMFLVRAACAWPDRLKSFSFQLNKALSAIAWIMENVTRFCGKLKRSDFILLLDHI